ncbi:hypothetical protein EJ05DRAFT_494539 [Pseudovirgaria hyperparasitica]|uniref:Protein CFT1 n=1 Tax=Pseudovirgaria hyperparasitica TaxID=470096 RepID=A0A6A6VWT0_9PEZI|nr:uncharacterized protein EJ05DRAFT_494539 [Pseudovirgaria hyperparasitica]KAF2754100.1 hypothetical protein EJ05DRAFT_494539 [Pseudovirgaria hyperparasitica]
MQCYTELTPPTAVTHALTLPFLDAQANNLIVGKGSLLQIFETTTVNQSPGPYQKDSNNAPGVDGANGPGPTTKLALVAEFPLSGTITSLARIKILDSKSGGEALLASFKDAKLSLVEWDPETHGLSTISIHYYEAQDLQTCPWAPDLGDCYNFLTADPNSRCAALKFGVHNLAILPFRQVGDDLIEDDYDPDNEDAVDAPAAKSRTANGDAQDNASQTPYKSSFVLPLTALDPVYTQPVHLAFLHEYREPTFGVIASSKTSAASLLAERKDILDYTVFTLDLEQRASTKLLTVQGLPYDVSRVAALPLPIGGALLLGGNEVIHVDQAGKTHAVAVNEFAKKSSSFPMADRSELALRLEDCTLEQISAETGEILLVLNTGEFVTIGFQLDGRSVSSMTVEKVPAERGGSIMVSRPSCATSIGHGKVFIGSEEGDSILVGWSREAKAKIPQSTRKKSHAELLAADPDLSLDDDDLEEAEDDDDLYNDEGGEAKQTTTSAADSGPSEDIVFRVHDSLTGLGLLSDVTLSSTAVSADDALELVVATGRRKGGAVSILKKEIDAVVTTQHVMTDAQAIWSISAKKQPSIEASDASMNGSDPEYDDLLFVSKSGGEDGGSTVVYSISGSEIAEMAEGDFERDSGMTVDVGTLCNRTKIVQLLKSEIRSYTELGLAQILPMEDEETGAEIQIVSSSFADPYLLILRDDASAVVFKAELGGDIEEVEQGDDFRSSKWLSGCIYQSQSTNDEALVFLINAEGALKIYTLPDLEKPSYVAEGFSFLPKVVSSGHAPRRTANKATITELLVADLGDPVSKTPHLIVRTSLDDLVIYSPFHFPSGDGTEPFTTNLRWLKASQPQLPRYSEEAAAESLKSANATTLKVLRSVGGYSTVFQGGASPSFILKEASDSPKVIPLRGKPINAITKHHTSTCEQGFASIDIDGVLRFSQLPVGFQYSTLGWAHKKLPIGQDVSKVCYYPPKGVYALATSIIEPFSLPEDSYHHEWAREDITFRPETERGQIKLLHPANWSIIDTYELEENEVIMCMDVLNLEVSETTHERRELLAVGTAYVRGEDLATKGCVYIFEIITVVPEPDRPETNRKLRLIVQEEVKGAVTALSEIGAQGFILVAQGQKCMVRGLKEDGTLLPVAFMDMQCYVTVAKALKGTGMVLMGDIAKGLWFTGYTEEPYKMILFGKTRSKMEVMTAEFLPHDGNLYIVIADADCTLHVMQYDPEHPQTESGARLLNKSTFHLGHFPTTMTLLPSTLVATQTAPDRDNVDMDDNNEPRSAPQQILLSTQSGSLGLITPVDEAMYRRLGALQAFLTSVLDHACGLNPRAHRAIESEGYGSRGILDGSILRRWNEVSSQRKAEGLAKMGVEAWVVRSDLEFVGGGGLGYL